jgi:hypothetical protein
MTVTRPDLALLMMVRHAARAARPWPSVETSGYPDRATGPDAVRYTSVDTATPGSTALQGDTPRDREETAR